MPNGLFWTVPVPQGSYQVTGGGNTGRFSAENVALVNSFQFAGIYDAPGLVSVDANWTATGDRVARGKGTSVPSNDPGAFTGNLAEARATVTISGFTTGFGFEGTGNTDLTVALIGTVRNGAFL